MEWKDKINLFKKIDVRGIQGNFFQGIKRQAMQLPAGNGLEIVQSFDPIPLYEVMEGLGYEHFTEQKGDAEFHAYFYRREVKQEEARQYRREFLGPDVERRASSSALRDPASSFPHQCCRSGKDAPGDPRTGEGIHPRAGQRCIG